jgi:hypothetical protein
VLFGGWGAVEGCLKGRPRTLMWRSGLQYHCGTFHSRALKMLIAYNIMVTSDIDAVMQPGPATVSGFNGLRRSQLQTRTIRRVRASASSKRTNSSRAHNAPLAALEKTKQIDTDDGFLRLQLCWSLHDAPGSFYFQCPS